MKLDKRYNGQRIQHETYAEGEAFLQCRQMWDALVEAGRTDVIDLILSRRVRMADLLPSWKTGDILAVTADARLKQPLWATVEKTLTGQRAARYRVSMSHLRAKNVLPETATVAALARVDWVALEAAWGKSPADWNHLRRAVGRFLSLVLRNPHHPFRAEIMFVFPTRKEEPRVPEVDPGLIRAIPDPIVRDVAMFLALTGLRFGEYESLTPAHWDGDILTVPGTKTAKAKRKLRVPREARALVTRCIPMPLSRSALNMRWREGRDDWGLAGVRFHDLRHLAGQTMADTLDLRAVANLLGHSNVQQTHRYASRQVTELPATLLLPTPTEEVAHVLN